METDILDSLIPVEAEPLPTGWLRALDIAGMVIAPLSITLPFFIGVILLYQTASSTGTSYYTDAIVLFFGTLAILILLGSIFWNGIKRYVNNQITMEEIIAVRWFYSLLILGSLILYFMIFVNLLVNGFPRL